MKALYNLYTLFIILVCTLTACEKSVTEDNNINHGDGKHTVTFSALDISQAAFNDTGSNASRVAKKIGDVCTHMTIAIFDSKSGNKVASTNKENTDKDFGTFTANLDDGTYDVVAVAHSCDGHATVSLPSKISFKNNKLTDTFYAYRQIDIGGDTNCQITLKRAVAMIRLVVKDATPTGIECMELYYTGGSSTFDATTGYGCVDSRQTEYRTIGAEAHSGESAYEIYTFPHTDGRKVKLEARALDNITTKKVIYTKTLDNIDVKRNTITQLSGNFYDDNQSSGRGLDISIDDTWNEDSMIEMEY